MGTLNKTVESIEVVLYNTLSNGGINKQHYKKQSKGLINDNQLSWNRN